MNTLFLLMAEYGSATMKFGTSKLNLPTSKAWLITACS